ncbi:hypothetical protein BpHYR1_006071 [Brachionus plicatilis]|uniref:Uncharacterized protein n=1 Tax=Brachionus plicatilis TaxID=10195 RepID=A0A3M7RCY1_BRAPC|nr:hypothetical protein BpHYR1_006071 [Brachionus plicatilis]
MNFKNCPFNCPKPEKKSANIFYKLFKGHKNLTLTPSPKNTVNKRKETKKKYRKKKQQNKKRKVNSPLHIQNSMQIAF